jgi:Site-specific recombinase XerD
MSNENNILQVVDSFLAFIKVQKRYSKRTVELYRDAVLRFFANLLNVSKEDFQQLAHCSDTLTELITKNNIKNHIAYLSQNGVGARTINLHMSALSRFCKYLLNNNIIKTNTVEQYTTVLKWKKDCLNFLKKLPLTML